MKSVKKTQKKALKKATSVDIKNITNFLFEVGILTKTPRSGLHFLGTGEQSVAEHVNRVCFIGYMLAHLDEEVDLSKVLQMCLFHDITETRISDLNYIHQKYVVRKEHEAAVDISNSIPFGEKVFATLGEYEKRESKESLIVKDSDNLEWILTLKEELDKGNERALSWIEPAIKRLKTPSAQMIAKEIMKTDSNDWWFSKKEQKDSWWINRGKK